LRYEPSGRVERMPRLKNSALERPPLTRSTGTRSASRRRDSLEYECRREPVPRRGRRQAVGGRPDDHGRRARAGGEQGRQRCPQLPGDRHGGPAVHHRGHDRRRADDGAGRVLDSAELRSDGPDDRIRRGRKHRRVLGRADDGPCLIHDRDDEHLGFPVEQPNEPHGGR